MIRNYPVDRPTTAPATGHLLYEHLMDNIAIPSRANHMIWYAGEEEKLKSPGEYAFRGDVIEGETLEIVTLQGKKLLGPFPDNIRSGSEDTFLYTFTSDDALGTGPGSAVLKGDLSPVSLAELKIPKGARDKDKVYNSNFKRFEDLNKFTKWSNELASLSLPKSISAWFGGRGQTNYSEMDVLNFLDNCFANLGGEEMMHLSHGNHMAWSALQYMRSDGNTKGDIRREFYSQNPTDFYVKDFGTTLPGMFFALRCLGQDPIEYNNRLDIYIWGAAEAATFIADAYTENSKVAAFERHA